ncbi:TPA: RNA-processing protein [Candidatus Woesearchaeota archaeon]|nr:RNA-processing protein [Candidatus Woesearchaeota archaeon]HIG95797.1 RNA-processing protein [Candidatus Woesearchaeota archaeon]HIH47326.1 RNA-processing protein [Candidatus Woesearchaeota archaeon]HII88803.1 RNA-processing protein [Candidatus Woesearchaeota archaeon]
MKQNTDHPLGKAEDGKAEEHSETGQPLQPLQQPHPSRQSQSQDELQYSYELKIPKERIAVLIGKEGVVKADIETSTNSKLNIDSEEGDVIITGTDTIGMFSARDVVRAIGRGVNPDIALRLLKPDYCVEIINLKEHLGDASIKKLMRLKGRIIGAEGKARRTIEELTESSICVYGKTITMIGEIQNVSVARRAVESLLAGSPHASVYSWLEKNKRTMKERKVQQSLGL